jgi:putative intracellular protease/amidase
MVINIKLSNDKYLIDSKLINSFTNKEEKIVGQTDIVPFSLETELRKYGAICEKSDPWQVHVVVDQRVITGQNSQSATAVGLAMANTLSQIQ